LKMLVSIVISKEDIGDVSGLVFEKSGQMVTLWILSDDEGNTPGSWEIE